ncbi:MAG: glycosyltransferase family 2 protein [Lachnospiraceae bacterium]|jgi:rhamnosyltransferase|nr:glycosyltransferase family 2 protein [Lachnospiraceae bacterium]
MRKIDIIIPVYKPDQKFLALVDKLEHQTVAVNKIIIMNTERQYFDRLVKGTSFFEKYQNVCVINLKKEDFDHGLTRRQGVEQSDAQVFVMMTMDAMPVDGDLVEKLTAPLEKGDVAVSYGRQMAGKNSGEIERYTRKFNYPGKGCEKSAKDVEKLGIKAFFCSNVCAAYRRDIYDRLGGFVSRTIFNEDMIYAAGAIKAGYKIVYAADAKVVHCHNYTYRQQFRRNFDLGVSQADHPEVFAAVSSEGEGAALIRKTTVHLWKSGKKRLIPGLYISSCFKYAGYLLGKHYKGLPKCLVLKCTMSEEYWKQK